MMNSTDVLVSEVSTDELNCTHCSIATYMYKAIPGGKIRVTSSSGVFYAYARQLTSHV